jgi:hypothetical protein
MQNTRNNLNHFKMSALKTIKNARIAGSKTGIFPRAGSAVPALDL